jgi:hypothetical protein
MIDQSGCKTDQPMPGPFSLTIQPRKQKALGTRLRSGVVKKMKIFSQVRGGQKNENFFTGLGW